MTIDTTAARVQQLLRELEQLHRRLESESRDEARTAEQLSQAHRALLSASQSFRAMKQSDVNRRNQDLLANQRKRASTQEKVAAKNAELHRAQADFAKAQVEEGKRRSSDEQRLRRDQENRDRVLQSQINDLRSAPAIARPAIVASRAAPYDAFISHATEDKVEVVRPLAELLRGLGLRIWYDEFVLSVGDSLRRKIDEGLAASKFGIVVLSQSFFAKNWPQYELDGLVATENAAGLKVILPIWHRLTRDEILARSPTLADRVALNTSVQSLSEIADLLASAVRERA